MDLKSVNLVNVTSRSEVNEFAPKLTLASLFSMPPPEGPIFFATVPPVCDVPPPEPPDPPQAVTIKQTQASAENVSSSSFRL
jgi:hypothetical protein